MSNPTTTECLLEQVKRYARARRIDVGCGKQTPRLASLMIQKYGQGVAETAAAIFPSSGGMVYLIHRTVDEESERIDPAWREHSRERWEGQLADVVVCGGFDWQAKRWHRTPQGEPVSEHRPPPLCAVQETQNGH